MNRSNLILVFLIVSVAFNGVLFGAGARDWFGKDDKPEPSARYSALSESGPQAGGLQSGPRIGPGTSMGASLAPGFDLRSFLQALPEDQRARAREVFQDNRATTMASMQAVIETRITAMDSLLTDEFDPEQVAALFAEARDARSAMEAQTEGVILQILAELSLEERDAALVAALEPMRNGPMRRPGFGGPNGPPRFGGPGRFGEGPRFGEGRQGPPEGESDEPPQR